MNTEQQKQSLALSSLHDISDYASYIDHRIYRLNLLYQKLSSDTTEKLENNKYKMINSQPTKMRIYETVKQRFQTPKKEKHSIIQEMYNTEYVSKRNRYAEPINISNSIELKTSIFSNTRSYQSSKKSNGSTHKVVAKNNQYKLRDYQKVKKQMLNSFYVGNRQSNDNKPWGKEQFRISQWRDSDVKFRKGRIWHGRPPVKIIEKYE